MTKLTLDFKVAPYKKLRERLLLQYTIFFNLLIVVLLFGSLHISKMEISADVVTQLQSFSVLLTLGSIPFILKHFGKKTLELQSDMDESSKLMRYQRLSAYRYLALELVGLYNIISFLLTQNYSFLLCAGMILVTSFFCLPTKKRIQYDLYPVLESDLDADSEADDVKNEE